MKQTYNVLNALMNRVLWVVLIGDDVASIFIDKCYESFRTEYLRNCITCLNHRRTYNLPVPFDALDYPIYVCENEPCSKDCPLVARWKPIKYDVAAGKFNLGEDWL